MTRLEQPHIALKVKSSETASPSEATPVVATRISKAHKIFISSADRNSLGPCFERGGLLFRRLQSGQKPVKKRRVQFTPDVKKCPDESICIVKGCQKKMKRFLLGQFLKKCLRHGAKIPADDACLKSGGLVLSKLEELINTYEVETKQAQETGIISPECWRFCIHAAKLMEAYSRLANTQRIDLFLRDRLKSRKPVCFPAKLEDLVRSWKCFLAKFKKQ